MCRRLQCVTQGREENTHHFLSLSSVYFASAAAHSVHQLPTQTRWQRKRNNIQTHQHCWAKFAQYTCRHTAGVDDNAFAVHISCASYAIHPNAGRSTWTPFNLCAHAKRAQKGPRGKDVFTFYQSALNLLSDSWPMIVRHEGWREVTQVISSRLAILALQDTDPVHIYIHPHPFSCHITYLCAGIGNFDPLPGLRVIPIFDVEEEKITIKRGMKRGPGTHDPR